MSDVLRRRHRTRDSPSCRWPAAQPGGRPYWASWRRPRVAAVPAVRTHATPPGHQSDDVALRKSPELYALAGQPQQPRPPATAPGAVGSTGSFGGGAQEQRQQQTARRLAKPDVLAPAGGWPQLRAAVENGADAVYFGVADGFNARARAANFAAEEVPEVMAYLHQRGVKGFVALNVLVFDEELERLERLVRQLAAAGVDAVIVQDLGAMELIRAVAPSLPIHGSTQATITSAEGAEFAARLGAKRVVVGRELSIEEIALVSEGTRLEVEAFCHGALCVSYSGQCFSSEAWGGRSANRGQCAQACRMPYALIVDGVVRDLADMAYLLSPQDLAALEHLPAMIAAGVSCLKIEGRLKGPEYVALTTAAYRAGVDAAWQQLQQQEQQQGQQLQQRLQVGQDVLESLSQVFSRGQDELHAGLTPGFLQGPRHQLLVRGRSPRHRGHCLGRVARVTRAGVVVEGLLRPVKRGDGLVLDQGSPEEEEQGGAVWDVREAPPPAAAATAAAAAAAGGRDPRRRGSRRGAASGGGGGGSVEGEAGTGSCVELVFGPGQVDLGRVRPGSLVWRTRDPALEARLRATYDSLSSSSERKLPVQVTVSGRAGSPLALRLTDARGTTAEADTRDVLLQRADKRPLTEDDVAAAVGQLGDNSLAPAGIDTSALALEQGLFLPASAFKAVRRAAAERLLLALRDAHGRDGHLAEGPVLPELLAAAADRPPPAAEAPMDGGGSSGSASSSGGSSGRGSSGRGSGGTGPQLRVLCRTPGQVEAALRAPFVREVALDFLEVHGLREAVAAVRAAGRAAVVALPRVFKPDEQRLLLFYLRLGADALLVRGTGPLQQLLELGGPGAEVPGAALLGGGGGTGGGRAGGPAVVPRLEGDFSLNAANVLCADLLLRSGQLSRLCPSHDLNASQLAALARGLGRRAAAIEAVVHQHMPVFHTEACVFARFLSDGNSFRDCGHPCERHSLRLRDSAGKDHLVLADMGCRNTVFNASAQSGLEYIRRLAAAGVGTFRIELVDEPPELVDELLGRYWSVMQGRAEPGGALRWLAGVSGGGVGAGSLEVRRERPAAALRPTARRG